MTSSVRIFDAESSPKGFLYHAVRSHLLFRDIWTHRDLVRHFSGRQLKAQFQGSFLGPFWVLLEPLFQFAIYFVVFGMLMGRFDDPWLGALWLFSGIVGFGIVRASTNQGLNSIQQSATLVQKVAFPAQLLPVIPVVVEVLTGLVGVALVLVTGLIVGKLELGWGLLALPWFMIVIALFSTGLGLTLANLRVFVPDVKNLYGMFLMAWFFLSPNFWWPSVITASGKSAELQAIAFNNPLYPILISLRQVLGLDWSPALGDMGSLVENLTIGTVWGLVFVVLGYGTFMTFKHRYADLL